MTFGEGTHSNRRFRPYTLDFYTKVQVWGRMVRASLQVPSVSKAIQKMMMSDLPCYIKRGKKGAKKEEKIYEIYMKKTKQEERGVG
jgi:hypothetical protein